MITFWIQAFIYAFTTAFICFVVFMLIGAIIISIKNWRIKRKIPKELIMEVKKNAEEKKRKQLFDRERRNGGGESESDQSFTEGGIGMETPDIIDPVEDSGTVELHKPTSL